MSTLPDDVVAACKKALNGLSDAGVVLKMAAGDGIYLPFSAQTAPKTSEAFRELADVLKKHGVKLYK